MDKGIKEEVLVEQTRKMLENLEKEERQNKWIDFYSLISFKNLIVYFRLFLL